MLYIGVVVAIDTKVKVFFIIPELSKKGGYITIGINVRPNI